MLPVAPTRSCQQCTSEKVTTKVRSIFFSPRHVKHVEVNHRWTCLDRIYFVEIETETENIIIK